MYYKLAKWEDRSFCFKDGKTAFNTEAEARVAAKAAGRYRVSTVTEEGRQDGEPFEVVGPASPETKVGLQRKAGGLTSRPAPRFRS